MELLRKREITSLCRMTLLVLALTLCSRDHGFGLGGRHVHEMTCAQLTLTGLTQNA